MSEQLRVFESAEFGTVRTVEMNGEPWFCLTDICRVLEIKNSRDAKTRLKEDGVGSTDVIDALGRAQTADFINESNMYKLVFQSRKPEAERFSDWVTSEVLPAIRQHGAYMTDATLERALGEPDFLISLATKLKEEREARKALEADVEKLQPKASYYDLVLQCPGLLSMTEIAKDYGKSAKAMNKLLHGLEVQYQQGGVWFLYAKYQDKGYTQTKTQNFNKPDGSQGLRTHMYWTQKGRRFLYDLLKSQGIVPVSERDVA